jgi:hypothetical protein
MHSSLFLLCFAALTAVLIAFVQFMLDRKNAGKENVPDTVSTAFAKAADMPADAAYKSRSAALQRQDELSG